MIKKWLFISVLLILAYISVGCSSQAEHNSAIVYECETWEIQHGFPWRLCIVDPITMRWASIEGTEHLDIAPVSVPPSGRQVTYSDILSKDEDSEKYTTLSTMIIDETGIVNELMSDGGSPSWSPDGKSVAFHNYSESQTSIDIYNLETGQRYSLVTGFPGNSSDYRSSYRIRLDWSPDGESILYDFPAGEKGNEIHIVDVASQTSEFLTSGENASWSPDGNRIAYTRGNAVWVRYMNTGIEQILVTVDGGADWPSWSPLGDEIVYVNKSNSGTTDLYIVNVETKITRQLTNDASWENYPEWVELSEVFLPIPGLSIQNQ